MKQAKLTKTQGIGIFVIVILLGLFVAINFLKGEDIFNRKISYYAIYDNVEGLTATGPVYIRGLKVGMIQDIVYNAAKDNFTVEFTVKSDYAIPANSSVELYSSDLLGGKALKINMGTDNIHAKENDTLKSAVAPDMLASITGEIGPLAEKLTLVMENLNTTLGSINNILDTNGQANISKSLANLNRTLENAKGITGNLNSLSPEIKSIVENFNKLALALEQSSGNISSSLKNIDNITGQLSEADLKATIESLKNLVEKLQNPDGSIGKLLSTDSMHNSIDSLINNINNFVDKMTENPKKFIKISVF